MKDTSSDSPLISRCGVMATHAIVTFPTCRSTFSPQLLCNYDGDDPWNFEIIPASWRSLRSQRIVLLPTLSFAWMDWDSVRRSCGGNAPYRRIFKSSPPSFRFLEFCRTWPSTRFEHLAPENCYGIKWSSTRPRCRRSDYWFSVAWKWKWCLERCESFVKWHRSCHQAKFSSLTSI